MLLGHAHALRVPAAEQHADGGDRRAGAAEGEHHAVEQERLPGALDQSHSDQTEGGNEHRDAEHGAGAEAVHGASHQGQGAGQERHEHRHAQRQGAAAPLQVIGHRVKQQADHESRTAVEQQHKETHDEDETGGGSGVHNGVAG